MVQLREHSNNKYLIQYQKTFPGIQARGRSYTALRNKKKVKTKSYRRNYIPHLNLRTEDDNVSRLTTCSYTMWWRNGVEVTCSSEWENEEVIRNSTSTCLRRINPIGSSKLLRTPWHIFPVLRRAPGSNLPRRTASDGAGTRGSGTHRHVLQTSIPV